MQSLTSKRAAGRAPACGPLAAQPQSACIPAACRRLRTVLRVLERDSLAGGSSSGAQEAFDPAIAAVVGDVLKNDPTALAQLKKYEEAVARLEQARAKQEELEKMFRDAAGDIAAEQAASDAAIQQKADAMMADAELRAAEKLMRAAEIEASIAEASQAKLREAVTKDLERTESVKAGAAAVAGGFLASAPLAFVSTAPAAATVAGLAASLASCLLFGVTYRYAVRADATNAQLRGGVVAAFALVRAMAAGEALLAAAGGELSLDVIGNAALTGAQSMLLFGFAAAAIEAGFGQGLVKRFGDNSSDAQ